MGWIDFALAAMIAGAVVVLLASPATRVWAHARHLARLCFQMSGVVAVSWFLVTLAENTGAAVAEPPPGSAAPIASAAVMARSLLGTAIPSIMLILVALALGTGGGLLVAFLLTLERNRWLSALAILASLAWVVPTFLLAIFMQEVQAAIYGFTGIATSGGYALITPLSVFWAALVLSIRPGIYVFRQARAVLDIEELADHVRAAQARGLSWARISRRYVFRPAAAGISVAWLNSLRLMVGALPLVEFFFAYPGLGQRLLFAIGVHYPSQVVRFDANVAIASVVALAGLILLIEAAVRLLQQGLDPRLREVRIGA
jgi:ABC-type dipeptide/oligopeptide/nickel transport system permease component